MNERILSRGGSSGWIGLASPHDPIHSAPGMTRTPLAPSGFRSSHALRTPCLREQGLTVGELVLIVLVVLVAAAGAWLFLGSQQPTPSDEATVQPSTLNQP